MLLPRSTHYANRLDVLPGVASTNDELVKRAHHDPELPTFSVVVTDNQTHGHGRMGRVWTAPPGTSLAISVFVRTEHDTSTSTSTSPRPVFAPVPAEFFGWFALIAGTAMTRSARKRFTENPERVFMKWPNDVLIGERKLSGVLCEFFPQSPAVVVGVGINLSATSDNLPAPTATSFAVEGVNVSADDVLADFLAELRALCDAFIRFGGDPFRSGVHQAVLEVCETVGSDVRVELPSTEIFTGHATAIDNFGRLIVACDGHERIVSAADVVHATHA